MRYTNTEKIEDEIMCPYCNYKFRDSWDEELEEGDSRNIECEECGKTFTAEKVITVDYRTSKDCSLNNEKHRFKKATWNDTSYECEVCKTVCTEIEEISEEELVKF